ncbi:MAG TPA: metallophosphoesterase [Thermomicrobiales bacterium]|jgi:Icc-related predicted phosphoesterase|nr:metallophosphoesterase [Thermomicrobiales bacterium]
MPNPLRDRLPRRRTPVRKAPVDRGRWFPADLLDGQPFARERLLVQGLPAPVRVAAIADFHARIDRPFPFPSLLATVRDQADLLLVAGDLTDNGRIEEFALVAWALHDAGVPVVVVPGNHDRRCLRRVAMRETLADAGVILLDGGSTIVTLPATDGTDRPVRLGIVGIGGYGGGFWPDEAGPRLPLHRATQAFAIRARREAARLDATLAAAPDDVDARLVLMHYSPTATTLGREPIVKYWMLGNVELARAIDRHHVDLVIHGHAHLGNPSGKTIGGTRVRNVATQVIGKPVVYDLVPGPVPAVEGGAK